MSGGLTYKKFKVKAILSVKNEQFACLMLYKNWIVRYLLLYHPWRWSDHKYVTLHHEPATCFVGTSRVFTITLIYLFRKKSGRRTGRVEWLFEHTTWNKNFRWHVASVNKGAINEIENWGRDSIKRSKTKRERNLLCGCFHRQFSMVKHEIKRKWKKSRWPYARRCCLTPTTSCVRFFQNRK